MWQKELLTLIFIIEEITVLYVLFGVSDKNRYNIN